jgi:rhodanese-related sulfurtransferase
VERNLVAIPEIDVAQLAALVADGAYVLDVRNPDEHTEAHVPGVTLIPLPEIPDRSGEVPTDRPVYIICAAGARSLKAAEFLAPLGVDATNVAGGTNAWIEAGNPVSRGEQP